MSQDNYCFSEAQLSLECLEFHTTEHTLILPQFGVFKTKNSKQANRLEKITTTLSVDIAFSSFFVAGE